jgi:hypothetical protein
MTDSGEKDAIRMLAEVDHGATLATTEHDAAWWRALLVKHLAASCFGTPRGDVRYTEEQDQAMVAALNDAHAMWKEAR